jgi:hypothetical protein
VGNVYWTYTLPSGRRRLAGLKLAATFDRHYVDNASSRSDRRRALQAVLSTFPAMIARLDDAIAAAPIGSDYRRDLQNQMDRLQSQLDNRDVNLERVGEVADAATDDKGQNRLGARMSANGSTLILETDSDVADPVAVGLTKRGGLEAVKAFIRANPSDWEDTP